MFSKNNTLNQEVAFFQMQLDILVAHARRSVITAEHEAMDDYMMELSMIETASASGLSLLWKLDYPGMTRDDWKRSYLTNVHTLSSLVNKSTIVGGWIASDTGVYRMNLDPQGEPKIGDQFKVASAMDDASVSFADDKEKRLMQARALMFKLNSF